MDKTLHYFKVALRQMGKYRVQTAISVAGLAICLLCFSLCMYISRYLMSTDGCFPHKERIARIGTLMENGREYYGTTRLLTRQLRSQSWDGVETFTWVGSSLPYDYLVETRPDEMTPYGKLYTLQTDSSLYRLFPSRIVAGSWEAAVNFFRRHPERPFIVPNPDLCWPDPVSGGICIGAGGQARCIEHLLREFGIELRIFYLGKPYPAIYRHAFRELERRFGIHPEPSELLMLGDSLASDIRGANRSGMVSALVLTGITSQEQALAARGDFRPQYVFDSIN